MISEVLNALLLTYLATEYSVASSQSTIMWRPTGGEGANAFLRNLKHPRFLAPCVVVVVVNLVERVSFLGSAISKALHQFLHIPKILFAAISYVVVLYYDCKRLHPSLEVPVFLEQVGLAFLYVLPVYPFLAVLISFGFLFVINIFEFFHWDEQILNTPIYFGVLYGPFSFVYWRVKEKIVQERSTLPTVNGGGGRVLGSS
eukprot:scaffold1834_cov175-Amphora_coffeaeformis.AAC.13